ncbi:efflux transporter [Dinoroseobacter shibae DFL 12 = DSM 16493]|jgi:multidrug efflux pump subunit AcrB|uniref:Efflux transporter n=1 Tax=Dinoroseobacter shibae (strain DSM 16493 / NCIMB 14021 / DFL 12) TaxID=398580 RepID=A8LKI6_DINSH|nr:efflux RND transporter permease subunit [Dinoroseobacter shibae]ABV94769.1 efflux transporter [Dinoroseobacter shibae DFL 12 = DSM 16493]URF46189.1 efflux RND transporter permease subunit [Dinoroseobacter shibae]URF50496.1 efflux RND transporter permease subunit [Dinoroseobacter shibae]
MNPVIKWMTEHPVAANLTMVLVLVVGLLSLFAIPQKTFPDFTLEVVDIRVVYPGASPGEIEQSIIRPIEDQISGIDGVDEVTATAREGSGQVSVALLLGADVAEKLDEVKTEIDRITTFPEDAEEPTVTQRSNRSRALEIAIHGPVPEQVLKEEAERLKSELTQLPSVSFVETANLRDYEISIEVDRDTLNAYGLTLAQVSQIVAANSLELPGGEIETATLSIPLRTLGRNYTRADFENIVVLTNDAGAKVFLRDIATVIDGFEDSDISARFGGNPSATVNVFRVGDEQLLDIVSDVKVHLDESFRASLPAGVDVTLWQNDADELQSRLDLLIENAVLGLALVVLCLTLFLDFRLAFWAAAGIAVAFAASFAVLNTIGMSINMISLFGFILAIGIVVDNAIVIGENIYKNGEAGLSPMDAAVKGTQRVAVPVVFSALTTVVAFMPLFEMPGTLGKFLGDIPAVVIIVLLLSLLQALFILPRNLSRLDVSPSYRPNIVLRGLNAVRRVIDRGLQWFIARPFDAALRFATRYWLVPIGAVIGMMIVTVGLLAHGYVKFNFFPAIDGKFVTANIEMVDGTTFDRTETVAEQVRVAAVRAGDRIAADLPMDEAAVVENIAVVIGQGAGGGGPAGGTATTGATLANVVVRVTDPELRDWPTRDYVAAWRDEIGDIAGIKVLDVSSALIDAGDAIAVELSLPDGQDIAPVVDALREGLRGIPGVFSIRDDLSAGRLEYKLSLREDARIYGVTLSDLASQMRNGFFGIEATRVQRGRDDVRVFVRLPANQRDSLADLLDFKIRTAAGDLIALGDVAEITEGLAPTEILRRNARTITTVTADVDASVITSSEANALITAELIPPLAARYEGLIVEFGGEQRTQGDAGTALGKALAVALFVIFALLALVFRSYVQPLVVMVAIPLGLIGAVMGHMIMGLPLTILSIFGIIGLAGVVINNSLVMIDLYNEYLDKGHALRAAVIEGTKDRFRPILLTSLTTFLGVFPLIMETSLQAQFLIPLAVSIGYGVLFGTAIILLAVPAVFIAQARAFDLVARLFGAAAPQLPEPAPDPLPASRLASVRAAE